MQEAGSAEDTVVQAGAASGSGPGAVLIGLQSKPSLREGGCEGAAVLEDGHPGRLLGGGDRARRERSLKVALPPIHVPFSLSLCPVFLPKVSPSLSPCLSTALSMPLLFAPPTSSFSCA